MSSDPKIPSPLEQLQEASDRIIRDQNRGAPLDDVSGADREVETFSSQFRTLSPETPPPRLHYISTQSQGSTSVEPSDSYLTTSDSDLSLSPTENLSAAYKRGIDGLIRATAKNEMFRDPQFSNAMAQRKSELCALSENDLIHRYIRSRAMPAESIARPTLPNLQPPSTTTTPMKVEDTFSWRYWTSALNEAELFPPMYEVVRRPSILAVVDSFLPAFQGIPDYSRLVAELVSTANRDLLTSCEAGRVTKWWTFGRKPLGVPFIVSELPRPEFRFSFDPQTAFGLRNYMDSRGAMTFVDLDLQYALNNLATAGSVSDAILRIECILERFNLQKEVHFGVLETEGLNWCPIMSEVDISGLTRPDNLYVERVVKIAVTRNILEDYLVLIKFFEILKHRPELMKFVHHLRNKGPFREHHILGSDYWQSARRTRDSRRLMEVHFWNGHAEDTLNDPRRRLYPPCLRNRLTHSAVAMPLTEEEDLRLCFLFDLLY